jgi:hypothetical protein
VNGHRLLGMNHIDVVTILKDLPVNVRMVCARRPGDTAPYRLIDTSQDRAAFAARVSAPVQRRSVRLKDPTLLLFCAIYLWYSDSVDFMLVQVCSKLFSNYGLYKKCSINPPHAKQVGLNGNTISL